MNKIEIKTESLPVRCEICHQADLFEPAANHCQRCYQVALAVKEQLLAKIPVADQADKREFTQHNFYKIIINSPYNRLMRALSFVLIILLGFSLMSLIKFLATGLLGIPLFVSSIISLCAGLYFIRNIFNYIPIYSYSARQISKRTVQKLIAAGTDQLGHTPLIWAISQGNIELIKSLFAAGADVNEKDIYGFTPLFHSVAIYREPKHLEMIKLLLAAGADPNLKMFETTTALNFAQSLNHREIVALIKAH